MQIYDGTVSVHVGADPMRQVLYTTWDNDGEIRRAVQELNFGQYSGKGGGAA